MNTQPASFGPTRPLFILGVMWVFLFVCWPQSSLAQLPAVEVLSQDTADPKTDPQPLVLAASGLPAQSAPESVLPAGAILHVRINQARELLDDASQMVMPFVPEKAVGPLAEMALQEPNPLLAMIGMQTMGAPMSIKMLSQMSGIDPDRPLTASIYLAPPDQGFAICVPVNDLDRFAAMLTNAIPLVAPPQTIKLEGGSAQQLETSDVSLFVVCSEDMVALCGSPRIAQAMLTPPGDQKLAQSPVIGEAVKRHAQDNLLLAIDTHPVKALLPVLQQFSVIPPEEIENIRREFMSEMDPETLESINHQLATRLGIRDVEQLMDYLECLATGTYEILFEEVYRFVGQSNGLTLAVDLTDEFQSIKVTVLSEAIQADSATQPIPLESIQKIIPSIPGNKDFLALSGQTTPPQKWQWLGKVIKRIGEKMTGKELPMEIHSAIQSAYDAHQPTPTLDSQVDWSILTHHLSAGRPPHEFSSLGEFLENWGHQGKWISLKAIPPTKNNFLENHFSEKAKITNNNHANWANLRQQFNAAPSWLIQSSHSDSEPLQDGITRLTYEDNYKTRGGLFGYNEHELINRYFTLYRTADDHTLLWPGGNDPQAFAQLKPQPPAAALERLLENARLGQGVSRIEYLRYIHRILDAVDFVASLETLLHADMQTYLDQVTKLTDQREELGMDAVLSKLETLETPFTIAKVNWNESTGKPFLVTPVSWTYPRPKLVPIAVELLQDFRKGSENTGGAVVHQRTLDGQFEISVVQSTAGLSSLIRTVGNNIADTYLRDPDAQQNLEKRVMTEQDQTADQHETILVNSLWSFLP